MRNSSSNVIRILEPKMMMVRAKHVELLEEMKINTKILVTMPGENGHLEDLVVD